MKRKKLNIQLFASTNKTTNYELSQYIGTDKPTYLGDYNSDMNTIDTVMKANATSAQSALSEAQSASSSATQAQSTATQAQSTAETANQLASTANATATQALQNSLENASQIAKFNLSRSVEMDSITSTIGYINLSTNQFTANSGAITNYATTLMCSTDTTGSIGKIYGGFYGIPKGNVSSTNYPCVRFSLSNLGITTPEETYRISTTGVGLFKERLYATGIVVGSDGYLYVYMALGNLTLGTNTDRIFFYHNPYLIFFKDLGDVE